MSNKGMLAGSLQHQSLEPIHSRYMSCLRTFAEYNYPQQPNRVEELLVKLPEVRQLHIFTVLKILNFLRRKIRNNVPFSHQVQEAAGLLLESKMFYVPFLLNSTITSPRAETEAAAVRA